MVRTRQFLHDVQDIHAKEADQGKKPAYLKRPVLHRIEELRDALALRKLEKDHERQNP